ncbi:MAG TPA: ornithine cyclodeaminase family protein [Longimicrobiaceae bacterium]|nr:ornithine cyclodeaminase family protein [Longimicrobiaceae bacterium]
MLGRSDVERLCTLDDLIPALAAAFHTPLPFPARRAHAPLPGGHPGRSPSAAAILPGIPAYTMNVNAKYPGSVPAIRGVVCLHDLDSGDLLALLDSGTVTALRTGATAALATHLLARPDLTTLAVIGAGAQARIFVRALSRLRSDLARVRVYDAAPAAAERFAAEVRSTLGLRVQVADSASSAARDALAILCGTWSRTPLLGAGDVVPGAHVTTLGADERGRAELHSDLLAASRIVADCRGLLCSLGIPGLERERIAAELADVVSGRHPGRTGPEERTVFASIGLPMQDLAAAWLAFTRAEREGAGTLVRFDL